MSELSDSADYRQWFLSIKQRIHASQIKAALAVNRELLELYWFLGEQIVRQQQNANWGDGILEKVSRDLLTEFPEIKGFSRRNLFYMRKWFLFWSSENPKVQQAAASSHTIVPQVAAQITSSDRDLVTQIPWGHNMLLLDKLSKRDDALFYVQKTIENNWSRAVLTHHIESGLHLRQGSAITNFESTLPKPQSDLAKQQPCALSQAWTIHFHQSPRTNGVLVQNHQSTLSLSIERALTNGRKRPFSITAPLLHSPVSRHVCEPILKAAYKVWIGSILQCIRSSKNTECIRSSKNTELQTGNRKLMELYRSQGDRILESSKLAKPCDGLSERLTEYLSAKTPSENGLSYRYLPSEKKECHSVSLWEQNLCKNRLAQDRSSPTEL